MPIHSKRFKQMLKVNSLLLTSQPLIALHSPNALFETGLRMCPAEKNRDSDPILSRAVRSLQSGLFGNNRGKLAYFAYLRGIEAGILCSPDCVAER
jgi:hypothetical protein